jgi:GT2 family glycosyltransferase
LSTNKSFVSIVIVNYNGFDFLRNCVASLLLSDYPFYEIIIVDNGSTDDSVSRIKKEFQEGNNRIIILDLLNNFGFAVGNKIGANKAKGEYILFLNSDTTMNSSCLGELVRLMDQDPKIGVAQAKLLLMDKPQTFDSAGGIMSVFGAIYMRGANEKDIRQYDQIEEISFAKGAAMIVRKEIWVALNGFDPLFFVYSEETDFCWRVWLSGYRVVFAPSAKVYHVGAATSVKFKPYFFMFQYYRNQIVTVLKNLSLKNLIKYMPGIAGVQFFQAGVNISQNLPICLMSNIQGVAWCLLFFNRLWPKRLEVQARRVVSDEDLLRRGAITQSLSL